MVPKRPDAEGLIRRSAADLSPGEAKLWKPWMDAEDVEIVNETLIVMVNGSLTAGTLPRLWTSRPIGARRGSGPVEIEPANRPVLDRGLGKGRRGRFLPLRRTVSPARIPGLVHRRCAVRP